MILIRGIYGEDYAKTIKNGKISCRDLLSTAIETHNTGYNYSDYYEKYLVQANNQIHRVDDKRIPMFVKRNKLILDKYIPNMYLTYFHILNEDSEAWVNQNFDDDVHFIYYIPRLDGVTGELIGDTPYFGKKMIYVDELSNDPDNQNWYIHMGLMSYIDPESPETTGQSAALLKRYNALMYPLFQRVKDEKFTSVENEFRIIYISFPRFFDGNWVHEPPKKYRFHVNGIPYSGEYAGNDIILTSDSAILQNRKTTLWNETYNNSEIKIDVNGE